MASLISQIYTGLSSVLYLTSPSEFTPAPSIDVDLEEKDPYTFESFEELQNQRFEAGMDYYICLVQQGDKSYLFDAERFVFDCIKNGEEIILNPLTREPIENFYIYVSIPSTPRFTFYMDKDILVRENRLPIFYNNPHALTPDQRFLLECHARNLKKKNQLEEAKKFYSLAAKMGSTTAKVSLSQIYSHEGNREQVLHYLSECLESEADTMDANSLFVSALLLWKHQAYELSIKAYTLSAEKGSQLGLAILINIFEGLQGGDGIGKDLIKAQQWRERLPKNRQNASMVDYFKELQARNNAPETGV
ncbi:MAG: hypothetical protein H7A41_03950 [Chlamydiales bacterium]|nr:hypothetical protein [Chlamydiales bacterium]